MQFEVKPKSSMFADILACWPTHTLIAVTLYTFIFERHLNSVNFKYFPVQTVKGRHCIHLYILEIFELIEFPVYIVKAPRE